MKAIPVTSAKEWVSIAYVEAIAAQVGLNIKNVRWDDGIDIEVGSNKAMFGNARFRNLYLPLQLKATENWEVKDGTIAFRLKASNYVQLRDSSFPPQYLVLYTLPHSRAHWIVHKPAASEFRHRAYFFSLDGQPELRKTATGKLRESRVVKVPAKNLLTAISLLRLYREACQESLSFGGVP